MLKKSSEGIFGSICSCFSPHLGVFSVVLIRKEKRGGEEKPPKNLDPKRA